jgi:lysosomal Pro-X carboxypeptidase
MRLLLLSLLLLFAAAPDLVVSSARGSGFLAQRHAERTRDPLVAGARLRARLSGERRGDPPLPVYEYETHYFQQNIDNFNWNTPGTFTQKYLVNTTWWDAPNGPIFFYTGNEAAIELFAQNSGFVWDIAPAFRAMVVFAEHRYYGSSMPFGNASFVGDRTQFLTSEQALADFATLIRSLRANYSAENAPLVAFGGSYGGMLAAWFRIKYPHVVQGAIAASAPIWQFTNLTDSEAYAAVNTRTFHDANPACSAGIRRAWDVMGAMALTPAGLQSLSSIFRTCAPLRNVSDVTGALFGWVEGALQYMAMADYPYFSTFLNPMPGYPVNVSCANFTANMSDSDLLHALLGVMQVFYNFTGAVPNCFDVALSEPSTLPADGWNYQSCTEMVMPIGQNGVDDMFYPAPWDLNAFIASCQAQFNVTPRPFWTQIYYGGHDIHDSTNIVFSNGNLDPWSSGGVVHNITDALPAVYIFGGAHHLDLRNSNPADPPAVIAARDFERAAISQWIAEFYARSGSGAGGGAHHGGLATKWVIVISVLATAAASALIAGLVCACQRYTRTDDRAGRGYSSLDPHA